MKSFWVISRNNVDLASNVSETVSVSFIRGSCDKSVVFEQYIYEEGIEIGRTYQTSASTTLSGLDIGEDIC
jgi:hypothetical protein